MGLVYIVGAGPGDPALMTMKGLECVREADAILYDRLVHPALLKEARPEAELIYVGKASSEHTVNQDEINRLLLEKAKEGKIVVRLKGGDPFLFGRGGEEAEVLAEEGIEFEVIPGVTSAIAVPAYAGIPVSHSSKSSSLAIITGREGPGKAESGIKWDKIATGLETLVFLMGVKNLPHIVAELVKNGRALSTPIALIRWGTWSSQETLVGTLENIVNKVKSTGFKTPAVIIVGEVARLREKLRWFDNRPLFGKKIMVMPRASQEDDLGKMLRKYGAEIIEYPDIRIIPPESFAEMDAALDSLGDYDWMLFIAPESVTAVIDRLIQSGRDVRWLKGPKIAAIGSRTTEIIRKLRMNVDFFHPDWAMEEFMRKFPEDLPDKRILLPAAGEMKDGFAAKMADLGVRVEVITAYRRERPKSDILRVKNQLLNGEIDVLAFTNSLDVTDFIETMGEDNRLTLPDNVKVVCANLNTALTANLNGLTPAAIAHQENTERLIEAILYTAT